MGSTRILIITRNFPPLVGGMERLNWHMAAELARHAEVRVIAPRGARAQAPPGVVVVETPLRPLWRFLLAASWQALKQAIVFRPDIVLAGSGLTAPIALISAHLRVKLAKRSSQLPSPSGRGGGDDGSDHGGSPLHARWRRIAMAVRRAQAAAYVHGLDLAVAHALYRCLWLPAIRRLDCVIANSQATASLAQQVGVVPQRVPIVHPGVALPTLSGEECLVMRQQFRAQHGLGERPLLLSVGRLSTRKGLIPFVREVLPALVAANPDICLVIVGDIPKDALAAEAEPPAAIFAAAQAAGVADNCRYLGPLFGEALSAAYLAADVHVFPVREIAHDPEGFGMVAIEAAAHGLPTVAYATGGVVDAVSIGVSGLLVQPHDAVRFALAVRQLLAHPLPADAMQRFASSFAWERFGAKLFQACSSTGLTS